MKKTQLVHFHGLLGTVAKDLVEEGAVTEADLAEYRALGTSPMAMRGSRDDHEEAALKLAEVLAAALESETEAHADTDADARPTLAA